MVGNNGQLHNVSFSNDLDAERDSDIISESH